MKKIILKLSILLFMFMLSTNVNASSFDVNIVGNNTFENEITLYIEVNNLVEFNGVCKGLCGLIGQLEYDKEKIELISINPLEDFDLTEGKTLVLYKTTGVNSGTKILSMTFRNKTLKKDETTTILFLNIVSSDGDKDIKTDNISKTIKLIEKENIINNTTTTKPIINNEKTTTKIKDAIKKSNNNYLSSITLSKGKIIFDKDILTYDIIVDYNTTIIDIKTIAEDKKSTITGNGNHKLNIGKNEIKITIKAEDGSRRTYTLNINREEKDVIVHNDEISNDTVKENKNYIMPIILISSLLIVIIIFISKKK